MIKTIIEKEREKNARRIETRLKENRSEQQTSVIVVYKQKTTTTATKLLCNNWCLDIEWSYLKYLKFKKKKIK